jgi:Flp pilus assembly protein TadG
MSASRDLLRRLFGAREGAAAVEAALTLPVLLMLLLGVIEFGRLGFVRAGLNYAVQEGARCAAVRPAVCGTPAQTAAFAAGRASALGVPASAFTVSSESCGTRVSAAYRYRFVAYQIFGASPILRAQYCRT